MKIPLVTLAGRNNLESPLHRECLATWPRFLSASRPEFVSDGTLGMVDVEAMDTSGLILKDPEFVAHHVGETLKNRPHLAAMRARSIMYRKLIDIPAAYQDQPHVAYVDTDVYVLSDFVLPSSLPDLCMATDDTVCYSGSWRIATKERAVPGLNAGIMIFKPALIDYDYLEFLTKQYFTGARVWWLAEQPVWAILMRQFNDTRIIHGGDARIIGGMNKRSREMILENRFSWVRKGRMTDDPADIRPLLDGALLAHMCGPGKRWIPLCKDAAVDDGPPRELRFIPVPKSTLGERGLTALRLFSLEAKAAWLASRRA